MNEDEQINHRHLLSRLDSKLSVLDPGAAKLARGAHILIVILVAALAAYLVERGIHPPESALFGMIAPIVGAHTLLFTVPGTRVAEAISTVKLTGIAIAVFALALAIGWADLGLGDTKAHIVWVAVIAFGFYLRRFGAPGVRVGMMLILMFMFVVILNPTRIDAAWWLLAAALGGLSGAIVSLLAIRPSASRAFFRQRKRFIAAIIARLKTLQVPTDPTLVTPPHSQVHEAWENLARSSDLAASVAPADKPHFEQIVAAGLRVLLALEVVADDADGHLTSAAEASDLQRGLAVTITLLSSKDPDPSAISACLQQLRTSRDDIATRQDQPGRDRFHQARLLIGMLRIAIGFEEMVGEAHDAEPAGDTENPSAPPPADNRMGENKKLGLRLALQAGVAAGITTALGLIFGQEHSYWATITVVIVIGATLGATIRRTLERCVGTTIGVAVAIAMLWLTGNNATVQTILIVLAILPITVVIERYYIIAAGLIGFTVVTGLHLLEGLTTPQMLSRVYETAIGAAIGLLVAWLLVPIRSADHVRSILRGFLDDCRTIVGQALAGDGNASIGASSLQKDTRDLASELSNIQSERLLARSTGLGTRRLQAHVDSLAVYVSLLATLLERLAHTDIPKANRALVVELNDHLSTVLQVPIDQIPEAVDLDDLTKRWIDATKLDGSIQPRDAIWLIEVLFYGRKCLETLTGLRRVLTKYVTNRQRRKP